MKSFKKALKRHHKAASGLVLLLISGAIFWLVSNPAIVGVSAAVRKLPIYCVQSDERIVSLTFDAAWGNAHLRILLCVFFNCPAPFWSNVSRCWHKAKEIHSLMTGKGITEWISFGTNHH